MLDSVKLINPKTKDSPVRLVTAGSEFVHESYASLEVAFFKTSIDQIALVRRQFSFYGHAIFSLLRQLCDGFALVSCISVLKEIGEV